MKYTVYIMTALIAIASGAILLLTPIMEATSYMVVPPLFEIRMCALALSATLSVVQLFKSMPRLMLLSAGMTLPLVMQLLLSGIFIWLPVLAAALLPALYELIYHGRIAKALPVLRVLRVKGALLGVAAAAAFVSGAFYLVMMISAMLMLVHMSQYAYYALVYVEPAISCVAIGLFCLLKDNGVNVLYRMLFAGSVVTGLLVSPFIILASAVGNQDTTEAAGLITAFALQLLAVVLVFIHAAKHRREDNIPPAPETEPDAELAA